MLNFALIGCGRIAKRHSELLGYNRISCARLIAVCDIDFDKANRIATEFNVPAYTNFDELMRNEPVDVAVILTPSGLHADHVIAISKYGRDIMVEKPMALTLDDADKMIEVCDRNKCRLFVVKQNRFNVPVVKLREAKQTGRFGKMVLGTVRVRWSRDQSYYDQDAWRGTWALDGGVLTNQASHHIDLLCWMMGDIESVFAKSTTALVDIETEDTAVATIKFKNGALGIVEATTAARPYDLEGSISLLGEKGSVVIAGFAVNKLEIWAFNDPCEGDDQVMDLYSVNPPDVYGFGHKAFYEHVVNCVLNGGPSLVDGLEGRKSLEVINAMYESIETGKEVVLRFSPRACKLGLR